MVPAVNAWTFPPDTLPHDQIAQAAAAGFGGLELVVAPDGPLRPDSPLDTFRQLAAQARALPLELVGLATAQFFQCHYAHPDAQVRQQAHDLTCQLLDAAAAAEIGAVLVVPAVVGRADEPAPQVAYTDAFNRSLDALQALRWEAEARNVVIAIENVWNRFLLSPLEAADLVDRVNSPHVGFYFDTGNVMTFGYPQDWITTLGRRIARVHIKDYDLTRPGHAGFCPLGEGSVDWPAVVAALCAVRYDGPLTYEGSGDPVDLALRVKRIADGRAPLATESAP